MDRIKCEKYHADIGIDTCIAQQKKNGSFNGGPADPGCADCAQGKEVIEKYGTYDAMRQRVKKVMDKKKAEAGENPVADSKRCPGPLCKEKEDQPFSAFGKNRAMADGHAKYCKKCQKHFNDKSKAKKQAGRSSFPSAENPAGAIGGHLSETTALNADVLQRIRIELIIDVYPDGSKGVLIK